jgi:tetratricopeptide (TPR) repeat protein
MLIASPAAARAQAAPGADADADVARAQTLYEDGNKLFNVGEYDQAIAKFKEGYLLSKAPLFLYNIAQAYRQKGDCAEAAKFYRNYLREAPDADNRARIEQRIQEMDACAKRSPPLPSGGDAKPPGGSPVGRTEPGPGDQGAGGTAASGSGAQHGDPGDDDTSAAAPGRGKRLAGFISGGAGLVLVGAGVYFSLVASDKAAELEAACAGSCDFADPHLAALDADGKAANRSAAILYAVGGVAVVSGVVLYLWGRGDERAPGPTLAIAPSPSGGVIVDVRASF